MSMALVSKMLNTGSLHECVFTLLGSKCSESALPFAKCALRHCHICRYDVEGVVYLPGSDVVTHKKT